MPIRSINPATEEIVGEFEVFSDEKIDAALNRAAKCFRSYRHTSFKHRGEWMRTAGRILTERKERWGHLLTEEMGKPIGAAIAEVEKCAWVCRYYAEHAPVFLADAELPSDANKSYIRHLPIGAVLAVMPWNFPFWQVFRFAAPALMAGNVGLLKHASNVPRCAIAIEHIFEEAGFPEGCFQTLLIESSGVSRLLSDNRVAAATLTGSEGAGAAVASQAGKNIKKTVLELGGSDPFIVMPSADVAAAAEAAVTARTINNGQSCIAAKRFIVHKDVYDDFTERFLEKLGALAVGDPMKEETDIGPLAMAQIRDEVDEQVEKSVSAGAKRLAGAEKMDGKGYFYRPGALAEIPPSSPAFKDEVFGPVALLFRISSIDEAIKLANATRFGLGAAIWTDDKRDVARAVDDIEAGATFVNAVVASDPRLPFGGVKASGYGRELSRAGILEFVNQKTISID